ncbi:MAG: hypothetical protein Q7O66_19860 [Dehalococcoidia bacterium]|nr:hypothetical protein [Dehalococcoidia bacterium]
MISLLEDIRKQKATEKAEQSAIRLESDRRAGQMMSAAESYLKQKGATNFYTNGYVYHCNYRGFLVTLCDQQFRAVGDYYRLPVTADEQEILAEYPPHGLRSDGIGRRVATLIQFRSICINHDLVTAFGCALNDIDMIVAPKKQTV